MALCLDIENSNSKPFKEILFLSRADLEAAGNVLKCKEYISRNFPNKKVEVEDWPGMVFKNILRRKIFCKWNICLKKFQVILKSFNAERYFINRVYGFQGKNSGYKLMKKGVIFFMQYETIVTDRLHGMILSILLGKQVVCFDNFYGKNSEFYNTWLTNFENCFFESLERGEVNEIEPKP